MAKISIIIPVYNVEVYLRDCLDSIINQTLKDIEIICVNDGSTDNSLSILNNYAQKDSRIIIVNQENQGLSMARNSGLKFASGEYIGFVDSDDWVDVDFYEKLYNAAINQNCDIAAASIIRKRIHSQKYRVHYTESNSVYTLEDKIKLCNVPVCCYVWNKIYKSDKIKNFKFQQNIYFEDMMWLPEVLKQTKGLVSVPDTNYYYRVNNNSIVKKIQSPKKQLDSYNAKKYIIEFFDENNLKLSKKHRTINKRIYYLLNIPLLKVKEYENQYTYLLFGVAPIYKKTNNNIFLIFNTACIGDVLVCNTLCQNIKKSYPDSKIVFIVNKPMYEVAKYQYCVDDVIIYDKKGENKGIKGLIKFIRNFQYKNAYASFVVYGSFRNILISFLCHTKHTIWNLLRFNPQKSISLQMAEMLKKLNKNVNIQNYPIKYEISTELAEETNKLLPGDKKFINISPLTKNAVKDFPIDTTIELIKRFNQTEYEVLITGAGEQAYQYAQKLKDSGCKFINLVDKTTILEAAKVIKNCVASISADTGSMHISYAVNTPTIAVFFEDITIKQWAPNPKLYNCKVITENQTAENIFNKTLEIINNKSK